MLSGSSNANAVRLLPTPELRHAVAACVLYSVISLAALVVTVFAFFRLRRKGLLGYGVWKLLRASTISFSLHCLIIVAFYALKFSFERSIDFAQTRIARKGVLESVYHAATLFHYFTQSLLFVTLVNFNAAPPTGKVEKVLQGMVYLLCSALKALAITIFVLNILTIIVTDTNTSEMSATDIFKLPLDGMMVGAVMIGIGCVLQKVSKCMPARLAVLSGILLLLCAVTQLSLTISTPSLDHMMSFHLPNVFRNGGTVIGALALLISASRQLGMNGSGARDKCDDGLD
ncbi:hypothetical protein ISF_06079 [Cordyceps fumosorosea ARSEF 2679]|uniref:Uncharacterized protein n=1 Tax=Cordyceps fumosorosea (strain ARSEF 2679) TaxID=1081104 RepID=A0A167SYP2_CORFA|nr:hypothetical protein ISF_06079 [Cordyceps fumosorosea ARSEF 2679]OAA60068.1 hypothetical protein ISF_06079 [Cordyceps fumosorosea ARSEF 2679]